MGNLIDTVSNNHLFVDIDLLKCVFLLLSGNLSADIQWVQGTFLH